MIEKAIIALEKQQAKDADYIHLNIQMIEETINVLAKLKGTLQKLAI